MFAMVLNKQSLLICFATFLMSCSLGDLVFSLRPSTTVCICSGPPPGVKNSEISLNFEHFHYFY